MFCRILFCKEDMISGKSIIKNFNYSSIVNSKQSPFKIFSYEKEKLNLIYLKESYNLLLN